MSGSKSGNGQGTIEYALILILVAMVVIVIIAILGPVLRRPWDTYVKGIDVPPAADGWRVWEESNSLSIEEIGRFYWQRESVCENGRKVTVVEIYRVTECCCNECNRCNNGDFLLVTVSETTTVTIADGKVEVWVYIGSNGYTTAYYRKLRDQ